MLLLPNQRGLFDIPPAVAYFNCAYNAPQLNSSRQRLLEGVAQKSQPWQRQADDFFEPAERVRHLAAGLFGGDSDGWAVTSAASYGMSSAARAIEPTLQRGDRILLLQGAFPSEYLPWERTARERGAVLESVTRPDSGDWNAALLKQLDDRIRVVVVPNCHWSDGSLFNLQAIGAACRAIGAALVVDATQSLGALPLDVGEVCADFLVAAGYKWLLGPYGFALLWVAPHWRESRPLEESWLARDNARNFSRLADYSPHYQPGARRFDMGEKCIPTLLPGAIAALEQLREWTVPAIAASLGAINNRIAERLRSFGIATPESAHRAPHLLSFQLEVRHHEGPATRLAHQQIYLSERDGQCRIAPHLHISTEDEERLLAALEEYVQPTTQ